MALLTPAQREAARIRLHAVWNNRRETVALTKAQLDLLISNLDVFQNDNAGAINQSIDVSVRSLATTSQKAEVFREVANQRYIEGA